MTSFLIFYKLLEVTVGIAAKTEVAIRWFPVGIRKQFRWYIERIMLSLLDEHDILFSLLVAA